MLYVAKNFGRYHFFRTAEARETYLSTLPEWEAKKVELFEVRYMKGAEEK